MPLSNQLTFFVSGTPRAKQSFVVTGKGRGAAKPATLKWQDCIQASWMELEYRPPRDEDSRFFVQLHFNTTQAKAGDCDNLAKAVMDALNGLAWLDDDQVDQLYVTKIINKNKPGVLVQISKMPL